jgi:23S rRNA-/tRNA-specific pseudouridylate synthase
MNVCIDEARQQGGITEIDHFSAGRKRRRIDRCDPITGRQHDCRLHHPAARDVEHSGSPHYPLLRDSLKREAHRKAG